ncbi:CNP1-like family protein [Xylophilus sp. GOD-11R]|uniref:CNP1-like family protein n=1 Tax=Xylophilus sp. GOD-11R TaxID=3089814 RepID=UPI00298D17EE|nr:CNP1-like family protein [Xylophilus sp. GOD-11R]WPB57683.1 CNP1-like family protein [Xylophilus sp. GOD-11R]
MKTFSCLAALLMAGSASAGLLFTPEGGYTELPIKPAPPFNPDKTIPLDKRVGTTLEIGIDPTTITSDSDGVVRYVLVARSSSGTTTAMYEGIRCATAEVKQYARHFTDGGWRPVTDPKWGSLYDGGTARYSLIAAQSGICQDASAGGTAQKIIQNLSSDILRRVP